MLCLFNRRSSGRRVNDLSVKTMGAKYAYRLQYIVVLSVVAMATSAPFVSEVSRFYICHDNDQLSTCRKIEYLYVC